MKVPFVGFDTISNKISPALFMGISTIKAGDMGPFTVQGRANRENLCNLLSIPFTDLYYTKQEHTQKVALVPFAVDDNRVDSSKTGPAAFKQSDASERDRLTVNSGHNGYIVADGLVTSGTGLFLGITVADCLPLYFADKRGQSCGIVHSGWKGTGIARTCVELLVRQTELPPTEFIAYIGPCIGVCCYAVDEERALLFKQKWGADTVSEREGRYFIDLKQANVNILKNAGIQEIHVSESCTACGSQWGSFRRQGKDFTRMLALIGYFR